MALELKDLRLPAREWNIGDPKEAILDLLQGLRLCKAEGTWEPLQAWIDAHNGDKPVIPKGTDA